MIEGHGDRGEGVVVVTHKNPKMRKPRSDFFMVCPRHVSTSLVSLNPHTEVERESECPRRARSAAQACAVTRGW